MDNEEQYYVGIEIANLTPAHTQMNLFGNIALGVNYTRASYGSLTMRNEETYHFIKRVQPIRVAFNVHGEEYAEHIIRACEELGLVRIIQVNEIDDRVRRILYCHPDRHEVTEAGAADEW